MALSGNARDLTDCTFAIAKTNLGNRQPIAVEMQLISFMKRVNSVFLKFESTKCAEGSLKLSDLVDMLHACSPITCDLSKRPLSEIPCLWTHHLSTYNELPIVDALRRADNDTQLVNRSGASQKAVTPVRKFYVKKLADLRLDSWYSCFDTCHRSGDRLQDTVV